MTPMYGAGGRGSRFMRPVMGVPGSARRGGCVSGARFWVRASLHGRASRARPTCETAGRKHGPRPRQHGTGDRVGPTTSRLVGQLKFELIESGRLRGCFAPPQRMVLEWRTLQKRCRAERQSGVSPWSNGFVLLRSTRSAKQEVDAARLPVVRKLDLLGNFDK